MNVPNPDQYGPLAGVGASSRDDYGCCSCDCICFSRTESVGTIRGGYLAWTSKGRRVVDWSPRGVNVGDTVGAVRLASSKASCTRDGYFTVIFLLAYGFLVATQTFEIIYSPSANKYTTKNIIGGFWLTKEALSLKKKHKVTSTQEFLKGAEYDVDKVWSRPSRALAKLLFVVCYLGLTVSGTLALACAAIVLDLSTKK